jgi:hypothetical protein
MQEDEGKGDRKKDFSVFARNVSKDAGKLESLTLWGQPFFVFETTRDFEFIKLT